MVGDDGEQENNDLVSILSDDSRDTAPYDPPTDPEDPREERRRRRSERRQKKRAPKTGLGKIIDRVADEVAIAAKDITLEFTSGVVKVGKDVAWFSSDPERYLERKGDEIKDGLADAKDTVKETFGKVGVGTKNAVQGVSDSVTHRTKRVVDSTKEVGYTIREKGIGGVAGDAVSATGRGIDKSVTAVTEGQLAAGQDLYVPGFETLLGQYLPQQVRKRQADEVGKFITALNEDYQTFPKELNLASKKSASRSAQTRLKILEDFIGYGTTEVDELLYHLRLRRGGSADDTSDFSYDENPTLTLNEIRVLEGVVGTDIKEERTNYLKGSKKEE